MNYQSLRQDELERVSSLFKILGHPKRLQLLYLLMQNRMTVSEISQALDWEQSAVSHQLQLLKQKKLVTASRRGKNMVYQLTSPQIMALIADAIEDRNLGR
ncbi:ArsR/SmtB family transcription factor [Limosilactobacillus ingluviei]|uniref:HTH arsR-type domain-containing protein n=1 Tax=Limosilactobacillus ingluviei DSM 15946 TaxID=1423760 RepID=A0A0R1UKE8_9LACO|nr:metalloregulator ArsR/SmtB family transcription factor [Limosilactobacillus ingluviei]KRL91763.1 hypothetical protein FC43_GL000733 [Limosilactobacillus ingluviei DSM 15946]MDO4603386.1 metalloregulator ArsR/SmtB family transcription factor [Limosilactobacillus ingluviei]HJG49346.1 metalloregulator ArsR/SmtB family transcription factor [Limosilactobacillus ingluviei]